MNQGEQIVELRKMLQEVEKVIAGILEQQKSIAKSSDALNEGREKTVESLNDLRRESEKEIVGLKRDIDEIRRSVARIEEAWKTTAIVCMS